VPASGPTSRPNWDDIWNAVAATMSTHSLCVRAKVGAVVVTDANRVVAVGYNGPPQGFTHADAPCTQWCPRAAGEETRLGLTNLGRILDPEYNDCPALHAEANALLVCDRVDREGGTIYVNGHVCYNCAKLIANSGLDCVVVGLDPGERDRAYREPSKSYEFLERCGVAVIISEKK
jgi:dCMP deaminase